MTNKRNKKVEWVAISQSLQSVICNTLCGLYYSIEVSFNNILRRIWHLPRNCHTSILHLTARLPSLFNVVSSRSLSLVSSALSCPSLVVRKVFRDSRFLAYTHTGYNSICGNLHTKKYTMRMVYVPLSSGTFARLEHTRTQISMT